MLGCGIESSGSLSLLLMGRPRKAECAHLGQLRLVSLAYPEANDPGAAHVGNFKPVTLPSELPVPSEEARACVHSFANATGIPADRVMTDALLYWWDNYGGSVVSAIARMIN